MPLRDDQIERYARQLLLPEVGGRGQERLLAGRVLVAGAGGLGSPAACYLAAAGVGTLGLADGDRVEASNLNRQILHHTPDLGRSKVESAAEKLAALNPDVRIIRHPIRLHPGNILPLLAGYDFVVDATDSFASKFLLVDACHLARKPYVHAGVRRGAGQAMTVLPGESACCRCLFDGPPDPDVAGTCADAGILGPVAGLFGVLQATEAIKWLLGRGQLLTNRLLVWDAWAMRFRDVPVPRNPRCPLCGENPTVFGLDDPAFDSLNHDSGGACCAAGAGPCCPSGPDPGGAAAGGARPA